MWARSLAHTKGRFTQGVKAVLKPNPCCPLVEIMKSASRPLHKESRPELGGYWVFVILTGVDMMDEYKIMEIRVYI